MTTPPPTKLPAQHTKHVWEIDFSDDGSLLVSGGTDGKVLVWNTADNNLVRRSATGDRRSSLYASPAEENSSRPAASTTKSRFGTSHGRRVRNWSKSFRPLGAPIGSHSIKDGTILGFGSDAPIHLDVVDIELG